MNKSTGWLKRSDLWWKGISSPKRTVIAVGYEVFVYLLFWAMGVQMLLDAQRCMWQFWMLGVLTLLLCVAVAFRSYWWRKLYLAQQKVPESLKTCCVCLEEENRKLKDIALAALAVKLMVEHGCPINLEPLNQSLNAFQSPQDISKMN